MTFLYILQLYNVLQMSLYFAPAFFSHLLGKCLKRKYPIVEVTKLAFVVLGTFALVWWPFLHSYEAAQVMINYTLLLLYAQGNHFILLNCINTTSRVLFSTISGAIPHHETCFILFHRLTTLLLSWY